MGCSGGGGGLYSAAAPCCADGVSTAKKTTAAQTIAAAAMILEARIYRHTITVKVRQKPDTTYCGGRYGDETRFISQRSVRFEPAAGRGPKQFCRRQRCHAKGPGRHSRRAAVVEACPAHA